MKNANTMLIIRLSALGDVAMTVPVIYSLAHRYPELKITVLTRPFFARLFIDRPVNIDLLTAETTGEHRGVRGLIRLVETLRHRRFAMVADLHDLLRSRVITTVLRLCGSRVATVDKDRSARRSITSPNGDRRPQRSYLLRYADTFARLGYPVEVGTTPIVTADKSDVHTVGIAPFARYLTKTYPLELMERVVCLLVDAGYHVILFGSKGDEAATLKTWAAKYVGVTSLAGQLPIENEIKTMAWIDVMVSMDSANMHLASLAGVPVVSIWGGTTPECGFLGWLQSRDNAVCLDIDCQPCSIAGTPECPRGSLECLRNITPEMIVDKVVAVISNNR